MLASGIAGFFQRRETGVQEAFTFMESGAFRMEEGVDPVVGFLLNAMISFSRSDQPQGDRLDASAESLGWIFLQSTGESSKPTNRSRTLRACCAFTRFMSMSRGFCTAFMMASLVISWKTILRVFSFLSPSASKRCQEMASPSRSSSDASHTVAAEFAAFFNSETTFFLSDGITYSGAKSWSTSTLNLLSCKSLMWPKLDFTRYSFPRNFWIVLAFAGDSTITKLLFPYSRLF